MTDRELLEKAANAAGLRLTWGEKYKLGDDEIDCTDIPYALCDGPDEAPYYWNPLEDDGDALRLAVKLRISLMLAETPPHNPEVSFCVARDAGPDWRTSSALSSDPNAATRRAIVRAAAAMSTNQAAPIDKTK